MKKKHEPRYFYYSSLEEEERGDVRAKGRGGEEELFFLLF